MRHLPSSIFHLLLLTLPGCTIFGFASQAVQGPPTHKAKYIPQKDLAAVVVENYRGGDGSALDPDQIAVFTCDQLKRHDVVPLVDATAVYDLRARDPKAFHAMTMAAIGRAVGAKQVIYVDLQESQVEGPLGSNTLRGAITARVRVLDAATGATRWPKESVGGYPLSFQTQYTEQLPGMPYDAVREKLNRAAGDAIAKLFYTWQEPD